MEATTRTGALARKSSKLRDVRTIEARLSEKALAVLAHDPHPLTREIRSRKSKEITFAVLGSVLAAVLVAHIPQVGKRQFDFSG